MLACLAAAYALFTFTYVPINHLSIGRRAHVLLLPGEDRLPFVPWLEYLYVTGYVLPLLLLVRPPDRARVRQLLKAFGLVLATAYTTYGLFPVYLERPRLTPLTCARHLSVRDRDARLGHELRKPARLFVEPLDAIEDVEDLPSAR